MLLEHEDLNFFESIGHNIHTFSLESVNTAVTNNYSKKYADVICTEDKYGYLVMLPANQVSLWAEIAGEIRPAGRNHSNVWTPKALSRFLYKKGAHIEGERVTMSICEMTPRKARGGNNNISGYKINPLFFVYADDCLVKQTEISFDISSVRQLKPTIAGKLSFRRLRYNTVADYYSNLF